MLNAEIGLDIPVIKIMNEFDAIVLCCGATKERRLEVPGSGLKGVHTAVEFLSASTKRLLGSASRDDGSLTAEGKNVVVVGGGATGTDCVATAVRQGALSVVQLEVIPAPPKTRNENNPWPLWPKILRTDYGQQEARELLGEDPRRFLTTVDEIKGDGKNASSVVTVNVEWIMEGGRMIPRPAPGAET